MISAKLSEEERAAAPASGAAAGPALPELETARMLMRQFSAADVDDFARLTADPEVMRHIGPGTAIGREEAAHHLGRIVAAFRRRGFGKWALVTKGDGRLVGYCGLAAYFEEVGVELVYLLARDCWGRGLASEASRAALRFGFGRLGLPSIAALTKAENFRSRRVLERLGMSLLGDARYGGYDCVQYAIRREEFGAADARARGAG